MRSTRTQNFDAHPLPDAPPDKAGVTIHQLLTHTGGIRNALGRWTRDVGRDELLERVFAQPLEFEPGSEFQYSNTGYELLGAVVESASGEPYRQYVRTRLLEPAGLRSTGFWGAEALKAPRSDEVAPRAEFNARAEATEATHSLTRAVLMARDERSE